jgi:hypothetical protein
MNLSQVTAEIRAKWEGMDPTVAIGIDISMIMVD